jgi:signal transduction histidine kinase
MAGYEFLRKVPLFAEMSDEDLDKLCHVVEEFHLPAGEKLFEEGETGDKAYVIEDGQIEILRKSGGREIQVAIRQPGEVIGEMSLLGSVPRTATGIALTDSVLLVIESTQFEGLLETSQSAARALLRTVMMRLRSSDGLLRQSEKMAQLGTLTAGIAHEINNPAAAARRGAEQLRGIFTRLQRIQIKLASQPFTRDEQDALLGLDETARQRAAQPLELDSLTRSDRESEIEEWLDDQGFENGWELAPQLAEMDFSIVKAKELERIFPGDMLVLAIDWLGTTYSLYKLLDEIEQGTERISEIVKALKSYVYLDQAPIQDVDIHEGIDNTLVILRSKLKTGVTVHREYASNLPHIEAYGSELNQVWTNLIDNAIDAMEGQGEITIRTRQEGKYVVVDIEDNGPGIPEEIQPKLFTPFFTTKAVGKGTGLGLNISYNIITKHQGDIKVTSRPGQTCFEITLPIHFSEVKNRRKIS